MLCFHGSDQKVDKPKILQPQRPLDFGGGFYVTTNKEQARNWAKKVSYRNNSNQKCINCYEFNYDKAKKDLKIKHFKKADGKWLDFICSNRQGKIIDEYDVIIGPVADDRVYRVVVEYENGDIDKKIALKNLKTESLCDQILFHTEKSLEYLRFVEMEKD